MLTAVVSAQSVLGSRAICPFPIRGRRFHACCSPPALHASRTVNARAQITDAFASRQWCLSNTQLIQTLGNGVLCRNRTYTRFFVASPAPQNSKVQTPNAHLAQFIAEHRESKGPEILEMHLFWVMGVSNPLFGARDLRHETRPSHTSDLLARIKTRDSSRLKSVARDRKPGTRALKLEP